MIFIGDFIMSSEKNYSHSRREYWRGVIEQWELNNLSGKKFCKEQGLALPSFYKWRRKLDYKPMKKKPEASDFLEVSIPASAPVQITLSGGAVIGINNSAKSDLLTRVFTSLRESGLC